MKANDEDDDLPPTDAEIAAWKAEKAARQAETFARCKLQAGCADRYGTRWELMVQDSERAGKCVGRCLCEKTIGRSITLGCDFSLTGENQDDGTWKPGPPTTIIWSPK